MSEVMDFYQQQVLQNLSDITWVDKLKHAALAQFKDYSFPSRSNEDWKYTSMESFLKQNFTQATKDEPLSKQAIEVMASGRQTDVPIGIKIALVNGRVIGLDALTTMLPPGVIVKPLLEAMHDHPEKLQPYLSKIIHKEHGFQALNTAMLNFGLFIYIPKHIHLAEPLLLTHWQTATNQATFLRHLIIAETGSSAFVIEDYQGNPASCYFTNTITEVNVASGANLTHVKVQRESKLAFHVGHIAVKQAADSQFTSHLLNLGGRIVRSDATINLDEPNAACVLNGIYAPADGQHMDQHTKVNHNVPDCLSDEDYKGILSGHSRAVFNGKVFVAKGAQHTKAKQQNKNLLLSKTSEIDTKPQLEIYADDVVCSHGATVGQLDEEALFYLATRGIDEKEASQYLIQAFAADNLRAVSDQRLSSWMSALLKDQVGSCYEKTSTV